VISKGKNPHAVAMGRLGGKAKAASLSPAERSQSAHHAVQCRWHKHKIDDQQVTIAPESLPAVLDPDQTKLEQHPGDSTNETDPLSSIWFGGD
jgi:hypothetical protein